MKIKLIYKVTMYVSFVLIAWGCMPSGSIRMENTDVPSTYNNSQDTANIAQLNWREYYSDTNLIALIDTALKNNQELNITLQEIEISRNEIKARKGEYLPFVNIQAGAGTEKVGEYTRKGAVEKNLDIKLGTEFPEPLSDYMGGAYASWELDVWKKLRNSKKAAVTKYLSSIEGRNFMVTNLISEVASSYYELMAYDNLLNIVQQNIDIQTRSLEIIKRQKDAAKTSQLAVNRFQALLLNTTNLQYEIKQQIIETENRINFLTGRFPQPIKRDSFSFDNTLVDSIYSGIPSQLLLYRPDIRQAEFELAASKLNVKVARANFLPSFRITAGAGFQAFNTAYLLNPESMLYSLAGDMMAPLINRNAIKATYNNAKASQLQAVYTYEQTMLQAYIDVVNQLSRINNYSRSYETKSQEVEILTQSITIANNLFNSARADYLEVLLTQRDALEAKMELIEIKMKLLRAKINVYKALGGGWN